MNPDLDRLQPYPFEKLAKLKAGIRPPDRLKPLILSIGEPKHPTPAILSEALTAHLAQLAAYPTTRGLPALRQAIADWLQRRFQLPAESLDPETQILPLNGTREGLFAIAQTVIDPKPKPLVLLPNPFYQIYEGAALLAGAEPYYLPCLEETGFLPDFESVAPEVWARCQLLYLCSPGNPTGAVIPLEKLQQLIRLSEEYNFRIASDECYSELYFDESKPPPGLLQAAAAMGHRDYRNCLVFHSLSKRSNAPGLRSGFVAGDARVLARFFQYRTYHGCAMPLQHQYASLAAWRDETHVIENRRQYREKFQVVLEMLSEVLPVRRPEAGFYLWLRTPQPDPDFVRGLFAQENLTLLPGSYLSRKVGGQDPGAGRVRMALVGSLEDCREAAIRIRRYLGA